MPEIENHQKAAQAYQIAFEIGLVGSILLILIGVVSRHTAVAFAFFVWSIATPLILPWLYIVYVDKIVHIPYRLLKGPHQ